MVKSQSCDPSREVRTDWPREILKIGILEMQFPAMPLLASGQCYNVESHQCLFGTFRSDQCLFSTFRSDQSAFNMTAAPSIRLLPLQYDCCPFSTTAARYDQYLPSTTYDLAMRQFCPLYPSIILTLSDPVLISMVCMLQISCMKIKHWPNSMTS